MGFSSPGGTLRTLTTIVPECGSINPRCLLFLPESAVHEEAVDLYKELSSGLLFDVRDSFFIPLHAKANLSSHSLKLVFILFAFYSKTTTFIR